jgi:hypothetical protein
MKEIFESLNHLNKSYEKIFIVRGLINQWNRSSLMCWNLAYIWYWSSYHEEASDSNF